MNILKISVLSISLATVTSAAAISPALGLIIEHFKEYPEYLVKSIITIPAIFIIFSNMIFAKLSNYLYVKQLAFIGFCLFLIGGISPFFIKNIYVILCFRAILGLGVGFLMPLSTSLLGYLFAKNEQAELMSLSGMCNQLGAVITVSFSGYLASISWEYSFLTYFFALGIFILVMFNLPKIKLGKKSSAFDKKNLLYISPFLISGFCVQVLFYNFLNNFSIVYLKENLIEPSYIGITMGVNGLCGAIASMNYSRIKNLVGKNIRFLGAFIYILANICFCIRFSESYYIFGLNIMLILGILGAVLNGIATGTIMPFLLSNISMKSKKINLAKNMAIASMAIYFGQFMSPFIDALFLHIFNLEHSRDPFLIATFIAIFLFIYNIRLKIKVK